MSLVPCPSCRRHVRDSEANCPFCKGALPVNLANKAVPASTQRMGRAAAFAFTASLAMSACGPADNPTPTDAAADNGGIMPLYGAPADVQPVEDRATPPPTDSGAPQDNGGVMPLYGAPADSGTPPPPRDSGMTQDTGGIAPLYGLPPDRDSGTPVTDSGGGPRDSGGVMALYGAVPAPDSGVDTPRDAGGIVPLYGAPAPVDAGRDASIGVRYGAPPPPVDAG